MGKIWNESESYSRDVGLTQRIEYDANNNAVYIGRTFPGASESSIVWQIQKLTYDANNNMTQLNWCQGTDDFKFAWTLRATYSYS